MLASYWEGCPNAVVESLACGTPVVATPVGSVPEMISSGKNGQIVPLYDVSALSQAIRSVLNQRWAPEEVSRTVCSWQEVAGRVENVFSEALQESRGRHAAFQGR